MTDIKNQTEKGLVLKLRKIRDKMNLDMQDMTFEELKAYLQAMKEKSIKQ